jgi:hypothetical protein
MALRQVGDVVAALLISALEGFIESGAAATAVSGFCRAKKRGVAHALLGLQNEVAAL